MNADDEKTIFNALSDYESSDGLNGISYLDHNQFAYCLNNPINMSDDEGDWSVAIFSTIISFGAALPLAPVVAVIAISLAVVAAYQGYRIYAARHRSHGKKGRPELKRQGTEPLVKKKGDDKKWVKRSGKKPRSQPRPHHPSKRGHRKY